MFRNGEVWKYILNKICRHMYMKKHLLDETINRAVGTGGGRGMCPPIIFSDLNMPFFKLRICEFSKPRSFS